MGAEPTRQPGGLASRRPVRHPHVGLPVAQHPDVSTARLVADASRLGGLASPSTTGPLRTPQSTPQDPLLSPLEGMVFQPGSDHVPSQGGAVLAPARTGRLDGRTVVVDPGHNGVYDARINTRQVPAGNGRSKHCNTSGATSVTGTPEHAFNWDVAVRLVAELRVRGATVILTRPNDQGLGPCVNERAAVGNRFEADLAVSIHADSNAGASARGFHIITSDTMAGGDVAEGPSRALAEALRDRIAAEGILAVSTYAGAGSAITVRDDLAGLNLLRVPGVMVEAGNMRHPRDAVLLDDPTVRQSLAVSIADGIEIVLAPRLTARPQHRVAGAACLNARAS